MLSASFPRRKGVNAARRFAVNALLLIAVNLAGSMGEGRRKGKGRALQKGGLAP